MLLWGVYTVVLCKHGEQVPAKSLFVGSVVGGLIVSTPIVFYQNYQTGLDWMKGLTVNHYLSLLYFGIFPSIIALLFFNKAALKIGPARASVYLNLVIVFTSVFGIFFLHEKLQWAHLAGGGLIITGVYLTSKAHLLPKLNNGKGLRCER